MGLARPLGVGVGEGVEPLARCCINSHQPRPLQNKAGTICRTFSKPHLFPLCSEIGESLRLFRKFRIFLIVVFCHPFSIILFYLL